MERMTDKKYYNLILADGFTECWGFVNYDDIYTKWRACCRPSKKYPMWIALHWNRNTDVRPPHASLHAISDKYNSPHPSTLITKFLITDDIPKKLGDIISHYGCINMPNDYKRLLIKWANDRVFIDSERSNWGMLQSVWNNYERSYLDLMPPPQHIFEQLNQDEFQSYD